jgi:hypothetical protein
MLVQIHSRLKRNKALADGNDHTKPIDLRNCRPTGNQLSLASGLH